MASTKTVLERLEAAKLKINPRYTMRFIDVIEIAKAKNDMTEMMFTAFKYGYLQGSKHLSAQR